MVIYHFRKDPRIKAVQEETCAYQKNESSLSKKAPLGAFVQRRNFPLEFPRPKPLASAPPQNFGDVSFWFRPHHTKNMQKWVHGTPTKANMDTQNDSLEKVYNSLLNMAVFWVSMLGFQGVCFWYLTIQISNFNFWKGTWSSCSCSTK